LRREGEERELIIKAGDIKPGGLIQVDDVDNFVRQQSVDEGAKALRYNTGKIRYELIPVEFTEELARVFTKGAYKYDDDNWMLSIGKPEGKEFVKGCIGCLQRHLAAFRKGESFDQDTPDGYTGLKTHHLAHVAWNALAVMYYEMKDSEIKALHESKNYVVLGPKPGGTQNV
jgi:hypothetical protein